MQTDTLEWWEKWPIAAVFTAQGLYVAEWYIGTRMPDRLDGVMAWLSVLGGVAAWFAIDGAMIATVMGMRQGRRSIWSILAIVVTAAFGAAVALDLHGAYHVFGDGIQQGASAWLHAGFACTIVCYLMHTASPKVAPAVRPTDDRPARPPRGRGLLASLLAAPVRPVPVSAMRADAHQMSIEAPTVESYTCPRCEADVPSRAAWLAARRWKRCAACKDAAVAAD